MSELITEEMVKKAFNHGMLDEGFSFQNSADLLNAQIQSKNGTQMLIDLQRYAEKRADESRDPNVDMKTSFSAFREMAAAIWNIRQGKDILSLEYRADAPD